SAWNGRPTPDRLHSHDGIAVGDRLFLALHLRWLVWHRQLGLQLDSWRSVPPRRATVADRSCPGDSCDHHRGCLAVDAFCSAAHGGRFADSPTGAVRGRDPGSRLALDAVPADHVAFSDDTTPGGTVISQH